MQLALPDPGSRYKSNAQRARVATEAWARDNLYCPACNNDRLDPTQANTAVVDFECAGCRLGVQLKAKSGPFGAKFANSAYHPKLAAIRARRMPDYALMQYDREAWEVREASYLPGFFLTETSIEARKPLSANAARAGWVGSNVRLSNLPPDAFVTIIHAGKSRPASDVRAAYRRFAWLRERSAESAGWTTDVLREVRGLRLTGGSFTLAEFYANAERNLRSLHPDNQHVRAKMRQQLQVLRDRGVLAFEGRGVYRVVDERGP